MNFVPFKQHTFITPTEDVSLQIAKPIYGKLDYWNGWNPTEDASQQVIDSNITEIDNATKEVKQDGSGAINIMSQLKDIDKSGALTGDGFRLAGEGLSPVGGCSSVGRIDPTIGGMMYPTQKLKNILMDKQMSDIPTGSVYSLRPRRIIRLIANKFLPAMFKKMRLSGLKQKRRYGKGEKAKVSASMSKYMKKQKGGAIGAILSTVASALPTVIQLGKTIWPHIKKAFGWLASKIFPKTYARAQARKRAQSGGEKGITTALGKDILKFLRITKDVNMDKMSGSGIFSTLKDIGKTFIPAVKRVVKTGKKFVKNPYVKQGIKFGKEQIKKTDLGERILDTAEKGYKYAEKLKEQRGSMVIPIIQKYLESRLKKQIPLNQIPILLRNKRILRIANRGLRRAGIKMSAESLLTQVGFGKYKRKNRNRNKRYGNMPRRLSVPRVY